MRVLRLGEVALVPDDSSTSIVILFSTRYLMKTHQRHLAIGSAYGFNVEGGTEMTTAEEKLLVWS